MPSRYGVADLIRNDLGLALRPAPGIAAGYVAHQQTLEVADAWRPALDALEPVHQPLVRGLLTWLDAFPGWAVQAADAGRQPPDLVAILRS